VELRALQCGKHGHKPDTSILGVRRSFESGLVHEGSRRTSHLLNNVFNHLLCKPSRGFNAKDGDGAMSGVRVRLARALQTCVYNLKWAGSKLSCLSA
jgi:hypothetical protein